MPFRRRPRGCLLSKCDLELVLDKKASYRPGETVQGMVGVTVNKACTCRGLTVTLRWRTHGRGNRAFGGDVTVPLFEGEWTAGERHIHPFELRIPEGGPQTYHGELLNVDWQVRATADIPWAFDPVAEEDIEVRLSSEDRFLIGTDPTATALGQHLQENILIGFGLFWLAICSVMFLPMFVAIASEPEALMMLPCLGPFSLIFFGVGAGLVFKGMQRRLAERRLGAVEVVVPTAHLRPGDAVPVEVRMTPNGTVQAAVSVSLVGREVVVSGSGTNRSTHTREFHTEKATLFEGSLGAGVTQTLRAEFRIPSDASPSFLAKDNKLLWAAKVHVDIPQWPDWQATEAVTVRP